MRTIELQGDYKNYYLNKCTILELSQKYNLSGNRIRYILRQIHFQFLHYLNTDTNKHLYELMYGSPFKTKIMLKEDHEKVEDLLVAFDTFTSTMLQD